LASAAATLGVDEATLTEGPAGNERWRTLAVVDVRASQAGIADRIAVANGSLVDAHDPVLVTIDPQKVRCRARALQSDLGALTGALDLPAAIVPAAPAATQRVRGTVQLGPEGDARTRTVEVFVTPADAPDDSFVRPGIAVFVELTTAPDAEPELAIPSAAVLPDGLDRVFFRRDPDDPDKVIRVVADLGADDGRWVAIKSGLVDGDQIVTKGAFELVLASSGQSTKGGHFHADGTWHEDHE
jgi:multidrug efflux pump subunit AcrA (membrane-fusion protein)